MHTRFVVKPGLVAALGLLAATHVFAMGHGHGVTKIDFSTSLTDFTDSRFFAKLLVTTTNGNAVGVANHSHGNGNGGGNGHGHGNGNGHNKKHGGDDQGDDNDENESDDNGTTTGTTDSTGGDDNGGDSGKKHGSGNQDLAGQTITLSIGSAVFTGVADDKGRVKTPFDAKLCANGQILMIKADGLDLVELFPIDPTDGAHQVTVHIEVTATPAATTTGTTATPTTLSSQDVTFFYYSKHDHAKGRNF